MYELDQNVLVLSPIEQTHVVTLPVTSDRTLQGIIT
jgi:hypothetical protein